MSDGPASPVSEVVRMDEVRRAYGKVVALDGARLSLFPGEVHAVLGENGAGKTTLLGVLAGLVRPDSASLLVRGRTVRLRSPREAWALGIALVHQHFALVPAFSALENLALGSHAGLSLPLARVRTRAQELMADTGLAVDLDARTDALGVGERQRLEILRALLRRPSVLVLDEPTAVLAPPEVESLFAVLGRLARDGMTIALVAHKLDEVLSVAQRVTVLREGRTVLEAPRDAVDTAVLVRAMVGGATGAKAAEVRTADARGGSAPAPRDGGGPAAARPSPAPEPGEVVARLEAVQLGGPGGRPLLERVDLEVRRGEVVGIAGVEGNGQRQLALVLAGRLHPHRGRVELPARIAFIPQDRLHEGLVGDFTLTENVALAFHREPAFRRGPFLRWHPLAERTRELALAFGVKAPGPGTPVRELSGGNQQRVVVARELGRKPELLVAENPTRGLDVSAAAFVHGELRGPLRRKAGVVLVSTDLDEVLRLSDRVLVMLRGGLIPVSEDRRTREAVGRMMLGGGATPGGASPTPRGVSASP